MTNNRIEYRAFNDESGAYLNTGRRTDKTGLSALRVATLASLAALGGVAVFTLSQLATGDLDLDYSVREPIRVPNPNNPGFDQNGRPFPVTIPRYPLDENATSMSGQSGDGVAQKGETIGENGEGEITTDLERKQQLVKELVPVYQKAFAGPPWYEVSQCPQSPSGFSAQQVGELCACKGCATSGMPTRLTKEAYPAEKLYQSLLKRVSSPDSTVYVERLANGQPVLGAILRPLSEDAIVDRYRGRVDEMWLRTVLPDRTLWLDEIFADLDARGSGNLRNLEAVIERSAQSADTDTVAFRTTNENLKEKVLKLYGNNATWVKVPDTTESGWSYLVIIKLP